MKKKLILIIFIGIYCPIIIAQKKEVYLNDDLKYISKLEFNSTIENFKYYTLKYDTDSVIINVKVERITKGKIKNLYIRKD